MQTFDGLTFVNREWELDYLRQCLEETSARPALIVVRAPTGFGKSTLTDRFLGAEYPTARRSCIVDPSIRGRVGSVSLHGGFFIQRVAESLNAAVSDWSASWPTLSSFLKSRRKDAAMSKDPTDIVSELPTPKHAYKVAFDYLARAFSFGRHTPEKILVSDQADAVATCTAYVEEVFQDHAMLLIVREAQHIDLESLKFLLERTERHPGPDLLIEYTTETGTFEPEHQKLLLRAADHRGGVRILDLARLSEDHLEYLIRSTVRDDFDLTSEYYLSWDGNLRSIIELKFGVRVGTLLTKDSDIAGTLADLSGTLETHVNQLTNLERLLLTITMAHVEAIDFKSLSKVAARIDNRTLNSEISSAVDRLKHDHSFITVSGDMVALRNDTIATALQNAAPLSGLLALSEKNLRDFYRDQLYETPGSFGLSHILRHYFRLSAKTKDVQGLAKAVAALRDEIQEANDQSIYVDAVTGAIEADPELYHGDHDELILWAAELAYAASDWSKAASLLSSLGDTDPYTELMRACALQESGGHSEALEIAAAVSADAADPQLKLACDLIRALVIGCLGQRDEARSILAEATTTDGYDSNPLLGYGFRFFEIVDGHSDRLENLKRSADVFDRHNLPISRAYSQQAAAIALARFGQIDDARELLAAAGEVLGRQVHDRHLVMNNAIAVELLSDEPDSTLCESVLGRALPLARDDFSELTILSNLSLALLAKKDATAAGEIADKCRLLLREHDFADKEIYWPVSFNMSVVYEALGDDAKREAALAFPRDEGAPLSDNDDYWRFRFGSDETEPSGQEFLLSRPWHPVYLSHWLIDLEGLSLLRPKPPG